MQGLGFRVQGLGLRVQGKKKPLFEHLIRPPEALSGAYVAV